MDYKKDMVRRFKNAILVVTLSYREFFWDFKYFSLELAGFLFVNLAALTIVLIPIISGIYWILSALKLSKEK